MKDSSAVRKIVSPAALMLLLLLSACQNHPPLAPAEPFDLDRFMGDWYVIGHIPPFLTRNAYNGVERYERRGSDRVAVTYSYRNGAFDGPEKVFRPVGFVNRGDSLAHWGMRFLWPFRADYRVAYVDAGYQETIVARQSRDYLWIMARTPTLSDSRYQGLLERAAALGYDIGEVRRMPQQTLAERSDS